MSGCTPTKDSPNIKGAKFKLNQCSRSDPELKEMEIVSYASAIGRRM